MKYLALDISDPAIFPAAKFSNLAGILNVVVPTLMFVSAFVFLIIMFWAGITWLTAGGNKDQVGEAKKIITYAILGLTIIFLSYLVVKLIQYVFNIQAL